MRDSENGKTDLHDDTFAQSGDEKLLDLQAVIAAFYRRRGIILATFLVIQVLGLSYSFTRRPVYESDVTLVVSTSSKSGGSSDIPLLSDLQDLTKGRSMQTQVGILQSKAIQTAALGELSQDERVLTCGVSVTSARDSDLVTVTASAYDPQIAAKFAASVAKAYMDRDRNTSVQATRQAREYVERELGKVRTSLAEANKSLADYKKKTGLLSVDAQIAGAADRFAKVQADFEMSQIDTRSAQKQVDIFAEKLRSQGSFVLETKTFDQNPLFMAQLESIRSMQDRRAQILQEFAPTSREAKSVQAEIADAEVRLQKIAQTVAGSKTEVRNPTLQDYATAWATLEVSRLRTASLQSILAERESYLKELPDQERGFAELTQDVGVRAKTYEMLSDRYYALLISEQSVLPNAVVLAPPVAPEGRSYPRHSRDMAMFVLLGLLAAAGAAYAAEAIDTKVRDEASVANLTGSVALSAIPKVDVPANTRVLIGEVKHNSAFLEAFRILRNNISFSTVDRPLKLLAITSAGRSEGKSTTTVNLAVAMAMDGKRVLLVDADLRRPSLHRWMKVSRDIGLTSLVKGEVDIQHAVQTTDLENVSVLPSGPLPPNPTEFLNSQHCRSIFRELAELYDIVILDCPPCAGLSDMQVIATAVDGVLLVVSLNQTIRPNLYITVQTLRQMDAPLLGFVLNKLDITKRGYGYYYYYYYYYDYEEDDAGKGGRRSHRKRRSQ